MNHEVDAAVILSGQYDLRGYPFPYLAVLSNATSGTSIVSSLLTAVGLLKEQGWELVSVANTGTAGLHLTAFLKRLT
ncbi:hypothetical protein [Actinoplanes sp. NPDC051859]|uniref:hypothetical protein n=1 Tax=Actinoplanes sp. NPDC051859 TaxID=3363909 RepID=UPI003799F8AE